MDSLLPYLIPVKGLRPGVHTYQYTVDADFFRAFPDAPLAEGNLDLVLTLDKRSSLLELTFELGGTIRTECDRCLANIDLPVEGRHRILVKYSMEEKESEDDEVIYIHPETPRLDVSKLVYEFAILAVPPVKTYDCESDDPQPCDEQMLDYLEQQQDTTPPAEDNNPFREALKNWKNNE